MCILLFCVVKCSLGLRELTMSYSYVKCFEGSVVWNVSNLPHEGILTSESNIICVQLFANSERSVWKQLPSLRVQMYRSCWKKAGALESFHSPMPCSAHPNLPWSRSAEAITSCWKRKRSCKEADYTSLCFGITWSSEVLNRVNSENKTAKPSCVLIISPDIL